MAAPPRPWKERTFAFDLPLWLAPEIFERLRGTPARLQERLLSIPAGVRTSRCAGKWSPQEHAGHLLDLEPLELSRLEDYAAGRPELSAADPDNLATERARHNDRGVEEILAAFRLERMDFLRRLEAMPERELERTALHPRLRQPMRVIDLAWFKAEHDDHHLAAMTAVARRREGGSP